MIPSAHLKDRLNGRICWLSFPRKSRSPRSIGIFGDPRGLRSLGRFFIELAEFDQSTIPDINCPPFEGLHILLWPSDTYRGAALMIGSRKANLGRLDAKGDGNLEWMLEGFEEGPVGAPSPRERGRAGRLKRGIQGNIFCFTYNDRNPVCNVYGDPDGLRSFGRLLIGLGNLKQDRLTDDDCPRDEGFCVSLRTGAELHPRSIGCRVGRLDARGDGSTEWLVPAAEDDSEPGGGKDARN